MALVPFVTVSGYWSVLSKGQSYGKVAADPFVHSLLTHSSTKSCLAWPTGGGGHMHLCPPTAVDMLRAWPDLVRALCTGHCSSH